MIKAQFKDLNQSRETIIGAFGLTSFVSMACRRGDRDRGRGGGEDHAEKHRRSNGDHDRHHGHDSHRSRDKHGDGHARTKGESARVT